MRDCMVFLVQIGYMGAGFPRKEDIVNRILSNIRYAICKIYQWDRRFFLCYIISKLSAVPISVIGIYLPKVIIDMIEGKVSYTILLITVAAFFVGILLLELLDSYASARVWAKDYVFAGRWELEITKKFMTTDFANTDDPESNNNYKAILGDLHSGLPSTDFLLIYLGLFAGNVLGIFSYTSILLTLSPIVVILLVLSNYILYRTGKWNVDYSDKMRETRSALDRRKYFLEGLPFRFEYFKDIKSFGMAGWIQKLFSQAAEEKRKADRKLSAREFIAALVNLFFAFIRDTAAYLVLIWMLYRGTITVGDFALYLGAIVSFSKWLEDLSESVNQINRSANEIGHYREYLEMQDHMNHGAGIPLPDMTVPPEIELKNVSYTYPGADTPTICDVNLKITAGEKIALVGVNGAGKTTLVKLLTGLYPVTSGELRVAGEPVEQYNIDEYYSLFSVVFQDFHLLPVTIGQFISSQTEYDRKRVQTVLDQSGLAEKIRALPLGIDTPLMKGIMENATDLSGGEKQRLMLARAFYKDAPIVILDEPTAALDPIRESQIYEEYHRLSEGKTSIFISHRLASTQFADRILLFENGCILEEGTHEELLKRGGKYAEMYEVQSRYYKENPAEEEKDEA